MKKIALSDNWQLCGEKTGWIAARVPGCVHTELLAADIIPDYFWRDNNKQCQWIEECDWTYRCTFDAEPSGKVSLVFEGLDTYADIYLNGKKIGCAENMFHEHEFDVSGKLKTAENLLEVRFRSPVKEVEGKPLLSAAFTAERLQSRRIQCTYGWDWVDRFVTCGIWRPVYLKYADDMYAESIYVCTESIDSFSAQLYTEIQLKNFEKGGIVRIEIISPEGKITEQCSFFAREPVSSHRFDIAEPELWYPNGYGEQPLYTFRVTVGKNVLSETFGIRTLKIMQLPDAEGSEYYEKAVLSQQTEIGKLYSHNKEFHGFQVIVNGMKILCKGANWVPCEPFPSAETDEKYCLLLSEAKKMNMNMLRVWGGGIFENDTFYKECDRKGILVVQDFLMACGHYPEKEEWFIEALQTESDYAVRRLRSHPCIAWWHGDNENAQRGSDLQEDYTGRDTAFKGVAPQIRELDRIRPFLPSSPYGGDLYASLTTGTAHISNYCGELFDYFNSSDCKEYKEFFEQFSARFISEEPTMGASNLASMLKFMTADDLFYDDSEEILKYHTKNNPDLERVMYGDISQFAEKVLGGFRDGKDRYFKYKYIQYEWLRIVFELCRRDLGYCNGMLFWMFDDCWPAALGWSLIDYYGVPKASYYAFRRCAMHLVASVTVSDSKYTVSLSNAAANGTKVTGKAYLLDKRNGCSITDEYSFESQVDNYSVKNIILPLEVKEQDIIVCDVNSDFGNDRSFYTKGNLPLNIAEDAFEILEQDGKGIRLRAKKYIHTLEIEGQYICSDNYFALMPDETRYIEFERLATDEALGVQINAYTVEG